MGGGRWEEGGGRREEGGDVGEVEGEVKPSIHHSDVGERDDMGSSFMPNRRCLLGILHKRRRM